jgi:hypothetical protein
MIENYRKSMNFNRKLIWIHFNQTKDIYQLDYKYNN